MPSQCVNVQRRTRDHIARSRAEQAAKGARQMGGICEPRDVGRLGDGTPRHELTGGAL